MIKQDKKAARKKILDDAFNIHNGDAAKAVGNWLQLLAWPVRALIVVGLTILILLFGGVKDAFLAIKNLPETCVQVEENAEDIDTLFAWHKEQARALEEHELKLLGLKIAADYARRRVD